MKKNINEFMLSSIKMDDNGDTVVILGYTKDLDKQEYFKLNITDGCLFVYYIEDGEENLMMVTNRFRLYINADIKEEKENKENDYINQLMKIKHSKDIN